jgi:hypothetical protein
MARFSLETISRSNLNLVAWPKVDPDKILDKTERELVRRRIEAIHLLLDGGPRSRIAETTGISSKMAMYLLGRCLQIHPDGRCYGFRALGSYVHIAPYRRTAEVSKKVIRKDGTERLEATGAFQLLLVSYPELVQLIDVFIFKLRKTQRSFSEGSQAPKIHESRIPIKALHKHVLDWLRKKGLNIGLKYPFNTKTLGRVSLSKYVRKRLTERSNSAIAARYGSDAVKTSRTSDGTDRPVFMPFTRVECDAHHIDAIFCVLIPSIFGEVIPRIVRRIWIITIAEVDSRVILGRSISLRAEPDMDDVLEAFRHALSEWLPRPLRIPSFRYAEGAGYPSSYDKRFVGACCGEISVDEALVTQAARVKDKLDTIMGAECRILPRHIPNDRPFVERFFRTFEECSFHRLPNTTGSSPTDVRRKNPELAAVKYFMQLEDLEEIADVTITGYNCEAHTSIGYRPPLEFLAYRCSENNCWPRQADPSLVAQLHFMTEVVTVHGDMTTGRRPFIYYKGARYTSGILKQAYKLIGTKLTIEINRRDLRMVTAFTLDGAELGALRAAPPWNLTLHTLEMRQAILGLWNRKLLQYVQGTDVVMAYLDYLENKALKGDYAESDYLVARQIFLEHQRELAHEANQPDDALILSSQLNESSDVIVSSASSQSIGSQDYQPTNRRKAKNG